MDPGVTTQANNLTRSTRDNPLDVFNNHIGPHGQTTTPPSPLTDTSSAPTLSLSPNAGSPNTDLTSLPSDVSKLSLGSPIANGVKNKPPLEDGPTVTWPYSHGVALDDIPGIAYALDTFLKSLMVESEEYCHRTDPQKYVAVYPPFALTLRHVIGNVCTLRRVSV
jgi:hypothetical protein